MGQNQDQQSNRLVSRILQLSEDIFRVTKLSVPPEWLSQDMTVAQLRVLLLLHTEGPNRMTGIAAATGATLPTITGTVEILVKKGLVVRRDDPEDRRLVICELSPQGAAMMDGMWALGQRQMENLLNGLSREELQKAREVAEILLRNITSKAGAV
jgi:DNA-binding MarR family transcriptional regulator